MIQVDICVVGAGSGGFAAAYYAAKFAPEKKVLLIESQNVIGGTSTIGGVNAWEPGCAGYGKLHDTLFHMLQKNTQAHMAKYTKVLPSPRVCAYVEGDKEGTYKGTLRRKYPWRVIFEPLAMIKAIEDKLAELNNLTVLCNCTLIEASAASGRIESVKAYHSGQNEIFEIRAAMFIDSTAEIALARMAECKTERSNSLNGVSQMFIVEEKGFRQVEPLPDWVKNSGAVEWIEKKDPTVIFNQYPDKRLNVNTLCTIDGRDYLKMGADAKKTAVARTYALWNVIQKERGFDNYRISCIFPMLGVREGYRLNGKYVLTEEDIKAGHKNQKNREHFIGFADHAMDVHDSENGCLKELEDYYGIPYECTLTNEIDNLAVACRGMSLSTVAASSCRLQRTMMQAGEAVGIAAAIAKSSSFHEIDCCELIQKMQKE